MRRLGVGGFASVWLYRDPELQSQVAVKALADNWAERIDIRERFVEEARILRRADSDHVVRVHDIGETDGRPYFVMTYADRGTVGDLVTSDQPIELGQAVRLIHQAGRGLARLHSQGVIHRDIKPANLLLTSDPDDDGGIRVMVADLGVAKAMLHASGLTQVVGTPSYMAPEQATGGGIDERADVHALGAVAYQLLSGHLIRAGEISALAQATEPPPPSTFGALPPGVDEVILRAVAVDPEQRWSRVTDFTEALRAVTAGANPTLLLPARTEFAARTAGVASPLSPTAFSPSPHVAGPAAPEPGTAGVQSEPGPPPSSTPAPTPRRSTLARALRLVAVFVVIFAVAAGASFTLARTLT